MAQLTAGWIGKSKQRLFGRRVVKPMLMVPCLVPLSLGGCVEQLLTIDSNPPGAIVSLNDQEIGRTPVTTNFKWYGWYDVNIRKDGYQTLKTEGPVIAPWWQWVPFDLFAEVIPIRFTDQHFLHFNVQPITTQQTDPAHLVRRGEVLRSDLEYGANEPRGRATSKPAATRHSNPQSRPAASLPTTRPETAPADSGA